MHNGKHDGQLRTRAVTRDDWHCIEALFGDNGACGGCWCMWWRVPMGGRTWEAAKGAPNRSAFRKLVESGRASGVLAFIDEAPVGWCAIGPRGDFPRIDRSKALVREWRPTTWSLNCLYVPTRWRGRGIGTALVAAAVDHARLHRASEIEAYPQSVAPGQRQAAAFVWTGVPALFDRLGFRPLGEPGPGRRLYLLQLALPT